MKTIERRAYALADHVQEPAHRIKTLSVLGLIVVSCIIVGKLSLWILVTTLRVIAWVLPRFARLAAVCFLGVLYVTLATVLGSAGGIRNKR